MQRSESLPTKEDGTCHWVNHWIPFTEEEVGAQEKFESHFMSDLLKGKHELVAVKKAIQADLFADTLPARSNAPALSGTLSCEEGEYKENDDSAQPAPEIAQSNSPSNIKVEREALTLSPQAQAVMDAGRELWRYYHRQPIAKEQPNASFYDIRLYFQGTKTTKSGKVQMNTESTDETYTSLITTLRQRMKLLAKEIEPKVYEYGFLKK